MIGLDKKNIWFDAQESWSDSLIHFKT